MSNKLRLTSRYLASVYSFALFFGSLGTMGFSKIFLEMA